MSSCLEPFDFERLECGSLDEATLLQFRAHLSTCEQCRTARECYRRDQAFLGQFRSVFRGNDATRSVALPVGQGAFTPSGKHIPRVDGYEIIGVLGQGGMGIVYRAVQTKLKRTVALKVLPAMVGAASPSAVSRFRREATAAARLHHTNIVPIYDFGESRDTCYYAMELIEGEPLNVVIRRFAEHDASTASPVRLAQLLSHLPEAKRIDAVASDVPVSLAGIDDHAGSASSFGRGRVYYRQAARWMADAADALHYAHGQGIIHRDIKPANLILSTDGRIMIADFGLAKSDEEDSVTITGSLLGTVRYLSPEQAMAKRIPVDHRTDVYSLGATMYELLCFQPAFPGGDDKQVLAAIITRDPILPRRIFHAIPQELETICLKTLEKSPDARYASARALAEDLRRFINDLPIVAKRPGPVGRVMKFVKRHKAATIAVLAGLLLGVAFPMSIYERNRRQSEHMVRLLERGDEASYTEVLKLDPVNIEALSSLAILKKEEFNRQQNSDRKLLEDANVLCDRALRIDSQKARLWNLKGVLLKKLGRYQEAVDAYRRGTLIDPADVAAWDNLGVAYALVGDLFSSEEKMTRASQLGGTTKPCNAVAWRNLASLQLFHRSATAAASIDNAIACVRSDEREWASYCVRARLHLDLEGHVDQGESLIDARFADRIAAEKEPLAKRMLALAYLRGSDFARAVENARAAIALGDMATVNHLIIAIAVAKSGDMAQASKELEDAGRSWPENMKEKGQFLTTAGKGILWFDSADELLGLRNEVARNLTPGPQ
ncbi:MAG: protein kinase [Planctomycetes bacterium]|nr:protein kinase [Planctomycetota bacterium]MBI3834151.1 protein kinase [Planctomycetota bacterium]